MKELINQVIQWGHDRNIIQGSTAIKQLDKTSEEFNELQRALGALQMAKRVAEEDNVHHYEADAQDEVLDAYGDILVTLILAAACDNINLTECLRVAYDTIKDRKGKMINGKFVKEADL